MSSITLASNCLGKKVVDDFDLIFEFGVGRNFDVQGKNLECLRHYRLQCQKGHVVLVAENDTALNRLMFICFQILNHNDKGGLEFDYSPGS